MNCSTKQAGEGGKERGLRAVATLRSLGPSKKGTGRMDGFGCR